MALHNAAGQMNGYLYQIRYALNLLFENDNPGYQISMEKFDDVAFEDNGTPKELIQLKHHSSPANLSDSSVDLWRSLNVWLDAIRSDTSLLDNTNFVIITTALVPEDSATAAIQRRDFQKAYSILADVAKSENKTNERYYAKFSSMDAQILLNFISCIRIISSAQNIEELEQKFERQLRYSCKPEHINKVVERIEGWWFQKCIKALCSDNPIITTQRQLQAKIYEFSRQYDDDNLPIEFWDLGEVEECELDPKERIFLDQLRLLQYQNKTLRLAIKDYYRASMQRSSWLRQGLVYANELDSYEYRLKDAWEHAFAEMEENLDGNPSEEEKMKAGRKLYKEIMNKDIRIRPKVDALYVKQGTYHHLANSLEIGWHINFFERLKHLLEGNGSL